MSRVRGAAATPSRTSAARHRRPCSGILAARARRDPMSDDRVLDNRFLDIETKLAYQEDLVASLNRIVSDQQRKLDELEAAYRKLV
ncbi:MAG TPA: SlyX family protein, partial [Alcanivorax sp.]|nr:SlyX family protein [Alcanivorax sp.]